LNNVRSIPLGAYVVYYSYAKNVKILRVVHGARDVHVP
jgi:plasmid stabilization system protein ParE